MIKFFQERPWIWILLGLILLLLSGASFLRTAIKNQPEEVPLEYVKPGP